METHDVVEFLRKLRIAPQLEGSHPMGLKVVLFLDAANGGFAKTLGPSHAACAQIGRVGRSAV